MDDIEWPRLRTDSTVETPLFGEDIGVEPIDLPHYIDDHRCGWCGRPSLFDPVPAQWRSGRLPEDLSNSTQIFGVLYRCTSCGRPHLVNFWIEPGEERIATIRQMKPPRIFPTSAPPAFAVEAYRNTVIQQCRDEAWASFYARRYRSAAVMARAALQAMVRRYLIERRFFKQEVDQLAEIAGAGWAAVGVTVKDLADRWAHPDPFEADPPSADEAREILQRMDKVLEFTAVMEGVGHLVPHPRSSEEHGDETSV